MSASGISGAIIPATYATPSSSPPVIVPLVAESAIAPASTGAQQAVAPPEKTPRPNTDTVEPVSFGCGTSIGNIVPRQSATATPIIIRPPSVNICACHLDTYEASAAAPNVIGSTTRATPAT